MIITCGKIRYSHLSNKRGAWNKRGGGAKVAKSVNVEAGILQLEYHTYGKKKFLCSPDCPKRPRIRNS